MPGRESVPIERGRTRRLIAVTAAVAVPAAAGALVFGVLRPSADSAPAAAGADAPLFAPAGERDALPELAGPTLLPPPPTLAFRALRGDPAFINVWASWCPSCREEAPTLARLAREYGDRVQFVGIDVQDLREDGRSFVRRFGLEFPHVFDPKAELATKLNVYGVPTAVFVDSEGRIAATLVGKQPEAKLRRYLRALARE